MGYWWGGDEIVREEGCCLVSLQWVSSVMKRSVWGEETGEHCWTVSCAFAEMRWVGVWRRRKSVR